MKFIPIVWATFLARVSPVSTRANPACMNMTRKPVTSVQTMFIAVWPERTSSRVSASPLASSATLASTRKPHSQMSGQGPVSKSFFLRCLRVAF